MTFELWAQYCFYLLGDHGNYLVRWPPGYRHVTVDNEHWLAGPDDELVARPGDQLGVRGSEEGSDFCWDTQVPILRVHEIVAVERQRPQ